MKQNNDRKAGNGLSRREFIKAAGVTTAGLMVSSWAKSPVYAIAPGRVIGANDRIGVGFVGVGGMGGGHLDSTLHQPAEVNVKVVAVCDVWEKRLQSAKAAAGLPDSKAYRDYRRLVEDKDVDAVIIATPEHWHSRVAIAAMENGIHCYIEKPMTRTLSEAFEVHDTALRTKRIVQVGSQGCSGQRWHKANELIRSGKLGQLVWSQGSYCRNSKEGEWNYAIDPDLKPDNCDWKMWLGPCPKRPFDPDRYFRWRKYSDYSAGILSDLFPHRLHPLMIALGPEYPLRVACVGTMKVHPDREVADNTQILVEFPSGHTMVVAGATSNEQGLQDMIRGHKATMYFGGDKLEIRPERPFADEIEPEDVQVTPGNEDHSAHERNFYAAIRGLEQPNCGIDLATKVQTIVCMAEASYRTKRMISFDPVTRKMS